MKKHLFALLFAPALLVSCESSKSAFPDNTFPVTPPPPTITQAQTPDMTPPGTSQRAEGIVNKYWKLVTLEGQPVTMAPDQEREAYFMLKADNSVAGFGGCNSLNGAYELNEDQMRLRFTNVLTTLKACPGSPDTERGFLEVLNTADSYTMQGDTLMLNVGRRAPLAVFQAVYF